MSVRIATFNVENLMARFDFSGWRNDRRRDRSMSGRDVASEQDYRILEQARVIAHEDDARQMTALALADCRADIVCLQEVEDLKTLEAFETNYVERMSGLTFPQKVWIEGNDSRGIDVALMARKTTADGESIKIRKVKSHRGRTFGDLGVFSKEVAGIGYESNQKLFRRDCLEVDLKIGNRPLTLFICHFKSMGSDKAGANGRNYTMPMRVAEAQGVRTLINEKFGEDRAAKMRWLVCGDLNDYRERLVVAGDKYSGYRFEQRKELPSGIDPLIDDGFSVDLVGRRPADDRWTLYHASGKFGENDIPDEQATRHLVQLDYLLASPALAKTNAEAIPDIVRSGQPYRTVFPAGQDVPRYPRTGWDRPKASDHCPVAVSLNMV